MINSPGVNEFIDLKDAPNSYAGQASKVVQVNISETAVEFGTGGGGGGTVNSVVAGTGISVDNTDPANPIVSATSSGGGISGQATVDFGPITTEDSIATVTVSTASVTTTSIIQVSPAGVATADHDPDDYQWDNISAYVSNIINGISFDIIGVAPNGSWGDYKFNYLIT